MKDLIYEIGFIFRGFTIVSHTFKELPTQKESGVKKDLRGAFVSAISTFAETAFSNNNLEYLESGNILFIFKMSELKSKRSKSAEPLILYGLTEKKKKNPDKIVFKFFKKTNPILENFRQKYDGEDFTNITLFEPFKDEIKAYFV
ncbi:MAG: hypothetical protein ACFFDO_02310 [Candidatus Thorarchaeota archaeon]